MMTAADPAAELGAIADRLRRMADSLPIMSACWVRILAEEIAIEAARLAEMKAGGGK